MQTKLKLLIAAGGVALLIACGGGGGGSPNAKANFTLPNVISAVPPQQ